jgi:trehalose/maltose hydrolase-like predicted phosphorylase
LIIFLASTTEQPDVVLSSHISRWNAVWSNGRIDIEGDDELQRQVNSALYYILSSLPPLSTKSEPKQFYGLSPGSLSWGGRTGESYSGRSFWDAEIWMYPSVLLFYPT